jgi:Tfp pilus assembly protein PilF
LLLLTLNGVKMLMKRKLLVGIITVMLTGLLMRLLYLHQYSMLPLFTYPAGPDVIEYDNWAKAILSGQWLWQLPQLHAPLYPWLLALLYKLCNLNYYWIRLVQSLIGLVAFLPLFLLLKRQLRSTWGAWGMLILAAVYPPLIFYQSELISEVLLLPLICITVYLFYLADLQLAKAGGILNIRALLWYILPGLGCGLAIICHPLSVLFCGTAAVVMVLGKIKNSSSTGNDTVAGENRQNESDLICCQSDQCQSHRGATTNSNIANSMHEQADESRVKGRYSLSVALLAVGIMLIATAIIVLPVMFYNASLPGGRFAIQHNSGFNFFIGNNSDATGGCYVRPGQSWEHLQQVGKQAAATEHISLDRYYLNKSFDYITENPLSWLKLLAKKFIYVWNYREMRSGVDLEPLRYYTSFQRWTWWSGGVLMVMALFGLFVVVRRGELAFRYRYLLALLFSFWIALTLTVVSSRYRIAMFPAVALFAGVGSCYLLKIVYRWRQWKRLIVPLIGLSIATAIVWLPTPYFNRSQDWAEADVVLGEMYLKHGKVMVAEKCFLRALKASAKMDRAYYGLGVVYMKRGQYQHAASFYIKSFQLNPYSCKSYVSLGILSMALHDLNSAGRYFAEAEKKWSNRPFLLYNYSVYLIKRKKIERAELKLKRCLKKEPANSKVLYALATIQLMRDQPEKAKPYFRRLLRITPRDHNALLSMAGVSLKTRQYAQADYYIKKLLTYYPESKQGIELQKVINKYLTKAVDDS